MGLLRQVWRLHTASLPRLALSLVAIAALIRTDVFAYRYRSGQAFFDFWFWVDDFQRWTDGRFTLHDLVKPHYGQHRIASTKLLLLADSLWFGMQGDSVIVANLILLAILGLLLWRLARLDGVAGTGWDAPPLFWIALVSAVCQVENIIFPFQVQFALTCVAAAAAASLLTQAVAATEIGRARAGLLAAAAGLCAIAAAFSMASGVLLAPALIALLVLLRARPLVWAAFTPICGLGVVLFFHHYPHTKTLPLFDATLTLDRIVFIGNFVGSSLTAFPSLAALAGLCALGLFLIATGALLRDYGFARRALPAGDAALVALGIFVGLCGPAASLTGRLMFGPQAALVTRYATMSLLFAAVLVGLYARWGARVRPRTRMHPALVPSAAGLLLLLNAPWYDKAGAGWHRVIGADAQLLVNDIGMEGPVPLIFGGGVADVRPWVAYLHARHLNIFAPENGPPAALLTRLRGADPASLPSCRGAIDDAYAIDSTAVLLRGWTADPAGHAVAWVAALDAHGALLGTARPLAERPDLQAALGPAAPSSGFEDGFRLHPPGTTEDMPQVRIVGLQPGGAQPLCTLPPVTIGPVLIEPLAELRDVQAASPPSSVEARGFKRQQEGPAGAQPDNNAAWYLTVPPPPDRTVGTLRFGLTKIADDRALAVPFAMAGSGRDRRIVFTFADGTRLQQGLPSWWDRPAGRAAIVSAAVLARHGGAVSVDIQGAGPGWLAIGAPMLATLRPDWSRLF